MVGSKTVISPAPAPKAPRAPAAVEHGLPDGSKLNLQVNFCKNPTCPNYGVPVVGHKRARHATTPGATGPGYMLSGTGAQLVMKCQGCGEFPPIKSNQGIVEELARISERYAPVPAPSCPGRRRL